MNWQWWGIGGHVINTFYRSFFLWLTLQALIGQLEKFPPTQQKMKHNRRWLRKSYNKCFDTDHVEKTWRAKRSKKVVSHYLEIPPKPPENEFTEGSSKSNAILKRCVLCEYKGKEKKLGGHLGLLLRSWRKIKSKLILNYLLSAWQVSQNRLQIKRADS